MFYFTSLYYGLIILGAMCQKDHGKTLRPDARDVSQGQQKNLFKWHRSGLQNEAPKILYW